MYKPIHFNETDQEAMRSLIAAAPLATFVVAGPHGLDANHIPFVLTGSDLAESYLHAHIPRANPLSEILVEGRDCLAIFHGPEGYISPSYYASKAKHGKVVPTWNYRVVHVHGRARTVDDPEWVLNQMTRLTCLKEQERTKPWAVSDAPDEFIDTLLKSLVGIEVSIERFEGKTKASQNQPAENQKSVLELMGRDGTNEELTRLMRSVLKK